MVMTNLKKKTKWIPTIIAACLCLIFAVPVFAATAPSFTALLSKLGPKYKNQL